MNHLNDLCFMCMIHPSSCSQYVYESKECTTRCDRMIDNG